MPEGPGGRGRLIGKNDKWELAGQSEWGSERTCDFSKLKIVLMVLVGTKQSIIRFPGG